jgi:hypothetical protein
MSPIGPSGLRWGLVVAGSSAGPTNSRDRIGHDGAIGGEALATKGDPRLRTRRVQREEMECRKKRDGQVRENTTDHDPQWDADTRMKYVP